MSDSYSKPYPLYALNSFINNGKINIAPSYQRESVWTKPQKRLLIDSILRGYDIPKLYFRKIDKSSVEFEVVDGHQRLDSIHGFFADDFALADDADDVNGMEVAGKKYSQLHSDVQLAFQSGSFDIVVLQDYTDDEIEDMFSRFQNGTPLNAAEKRRVIPGNMPDVVEEVSRERSISGLAAYKNKRFAFEDVAAKLIHLTLAGKIVDVRSESLKKTYTINSSLEVTDKKIVQLRRAMKFVHKALAPEKLKLNRIMSYMLPAFALTLGRDYNIYQHPKEFGRWYKQFEIARTENSSKSADDPTRDDELTKFTDSLRNDSVQALTYIDTVLRRSIFATITELEPLDPNRDFSDDQRFYIYQRDKGICQGCGEKVEEDAFHADHIKKHADGGQTTVSNGRLLCIPCNTSGKYN